MEDTLYRILYFSLCLWVEQSQFSPELYLLMTLSLSFLAAVNAHNRAVIHSYASRCIPLHAVSVGSTVLQDCGRPKQHGLEAPLSSLGFHEARRGCARPRRHPGSLLRWWPLGVARSRRTSATSSQLLWRDACSQHTTERSSQTNLRCHAAHCSGAGGGV